MTNNKTKLFVGLSLLVLIAILGYVLPQFYFNELELGFRQNFTNAYISMGKAEQGIKLRQLGPEKVNDEEFSILRKGIEQELNNVVTSLKEAANFNKRQRGIYFILPKKYKKYLELKEKSQITRYQLSESFLLRKQNEHIMTETLMLIVQIDQSINDMSDYDHWLITLDAIPQNSDLITSNADILLENNHINKEFHDYIIASALKFKYLSTTYLEVLEKGSLDKVKFKKELEKFVTPYDEVKSMMKESQTEWDRRNQEHLEKIDKNDQDLLIASNYFNENKLAPDPMSRFLAMFSNKFPRIKATKNSKPTIIPENAPIELLSYSNN